MQPQTDTKRGQEPRAAQEYGQIDWQAEVDSRWQALGRKIFVVEPTRPPTLREILAECSSLAIVWALVQNRGNFTGAARWLDTGRRVVRESFWAWRRANPALNPMPLELFRRWSELHGGGRS